MDALSSLYDCQVLLIQQHIIQILEEFADFEMGGARIVSYFSGVVLEAESSLMNFKATEAFLRFLTKVYKRPYLQGVLPE